MDLALARPPDPRLSAALMQLFDNPPFADKKGSAIYRRLFEALVQIDDPRSYQPFIAVSDRYRGKRHVLHSLGRAGMPALHACADRLAARPAPAALSVEAAALCEKIEARDQP